MTASLLTHGFTSGSLAPARLSKQTTTRQLTVKSTRNLEITTDFHFFRKVANLFLKFGEKNELTLSVYEKNDKAMKFYMRNDFVVKSKYTEKETEQVSYDLFWKNA